QLRLLGNRHVHRGICRQGNGELPRLTDDAHDLAESAAAPHEIDLLPDRALVAEELTHEEAIDDGDGRRVGDVTIVEETTADERDTHRAKIVAGDELLGYALDRVDAAVNDGRARDTVSGERQVRHDAGRL